MASPQETQWLTKKAEVQEDIDALLALGISVETARRLAGWNATLGFPNFTDVTAFPPPVSPPPASDIRDQAKLLVARSADRVNAGTLENEVLDVGKLYAVFIPNVPELTITQIAFSLDSVFHHTEYLIPWDYDGTQFSGQANRVTFTAGVHTIDAVLTDAFGSFGISASFEVE